MKPWPGIRTEVEDFARQGEVIPFLGAAISYFRPTSLPLGRGLLRAGLQGVFPDLDLFAESGAWPYEQQVIDSRSPEVVLQALAEGLPDRKALAALYNQMAGLPANPLHVILANAIRQRKVPAVFTTNQDRCIEDVGIDTPPIYHDADFASGLIPTLFQFHGAIGGASLDEQERRRESLNFTLYSMGPRLSANKHRLLSEALAGHTLLFLGYSGSDPDIWYSLNELLLTIPSARIYWCIRSGDTPSDHLTRLSTRHPGNVLVFNGDIVEILSDLAAVWSVPHGFPVEAPRSSELDERLARLRAWSPNWSTGQRELAYGWLLVGVGLYQRAAERLEKLAATVSDPQLHILSLLFAGYARRELSDHIQARRHLKSAILASKEIDRCRYAQAAHKLGESLSSFESVRFWYFWPTIPSIHPGARWLERAIAVYKQLPIEELEAKQLGRAGLANAKMNLGQLYRRTAAFTPGLRNGLAQRGQTLIAEALEEFRQNDKDLRSLPMAIAAVAADDPTAPYDAKLRAIENAIEYAEKWNQDPIQVGSAYFAKGWLLARLLPSDAIVYYDKALTAFQEAGMKAELARTQLELAFALSREASATIADTEGSWEWRLGLSVLETLKVMHSLLLRELVMVATLVIGVVILLALLHFSVGR
ncbi:MAG: SIR2 family protein [Anaerolineae bacterium]